MHAWEHEGYMLCPFCLGWNGDTVEGVSVPSHIAGTIVVHNVARLEGGGTRVDSSVHTM